MKPRVDIFMDYFHPGIRGGGTAQALGIFIEKLQDRFSFRVITRDRDLGTPKAYGLLEREATSRFFGIPIAYLPSGLAAVRHMFRFMDQDPPNLVYLNSAFSPWFTLLPLLIARGGSRFPILLAPRGGCLPAALRHRAAARGVFLELARWSRLYRKVHWHVTSIEEGESLRLLRLGGRAVHLVPDLPGTLPAQSGSRPQKRAGELSLVYLARVDVHKGLDRLLASLAGVHGRIRLTIAGNTPDPRYEKQCREMAVQLPEGIEVRWLGPVPHEQALELLASAHLHALPSMSENFGYTIQEALACGCPVLISDRTPWTPSALQGGGMIIPLEDTGRWGESIQFFTDLGPEQWGVLSQAARDIPPQGRADPDAIASMLLQAMER